MTKIDHSPTVSSVRRPALLPLLAILLLPAPGFAQGGFGGGPGGGPGGGGPGGRGGGGGFSTTERKLVDQFDKDGDKRLNLAERKAAHEFLLAEGTGGGRGGRGGGRGGQTSGPAQPGEKLTPADVKNFTTPLYDLPTLRTFFIEFEESNWETEMAAFNNTDIDIAAKVTVDGKAYKGVGVHFRGASSFAFVPDGYKRSLNLTFDFTDDKQDLLGYRTLNLLNSNGDPTLMRAVVYDQIAREYVTAARANFVRVVINGENWGIYQNVEQYNKEMVKEWWNTTKGARWKVPGSPNGQGSFAYLGDDPALYKGIYAIKSKDDPKDWEAFIQMLKVLNQTPPAQLETALKPLLDVDGVLKFLALDNTLINEDGYWTRASDYNIYRDEKGQFHVFPHDTNEALTPLMAGGRGGPGGGGGGGGADNVSLSPLINEGNNNRALASRLFAVPALKARYLGYVKDIATKWLDWARLGPIVQQHQALIAADAARDTKKMSTTADFTAGVSNAPGAGGSVISLRDFADKRRAYVLQFLADQGVK